MDMEHLPTLCLPDQSHNYDSDSVYFVLPNKEASVERKVFGENTTDCDKTRMIHCLYCAGVSCFRQISIDKLTNRSENDEFSRSSVQKSVCCLSRLPLFGYIEVKLDIIVDKIFEQGNFDCDKLLEESYYELNRCLSLRLQQSALSSSDYINDFFIETCLRELIILWVSLGITFDVFYKFLINFRWRHKILILFKLLLLEKRVLFFGSPVKPVCATILSVISLHPQLLNKGLCNDSESKDETFHEIQESTESPTKSPCDVRTPFKDKSPGSDDMDSIRNITILPSNSLVQFKKIFSNGHFMF